MTPPLTVQVGPQTYTVVRDADMAEREDCWGKTSHTRSAIRVDGQQEPSKERVTVLHEILHAVWFNAGDRREKQSEEDAIRIVAPGLLDTLRRNAELVAYLLGD